MAKIETNLEPAELNFEIEHLKETINSGKNLISNYQRYVPYPNVGRYDICYDYDHGEILTTQKDANEHFYKDRVLREDSPCRKRHAPTGDVL